MAWSPKTKPTPANIRKRIDAAIEALSGATDLAVKHPRGHKMLPVVKALNNANAWARDARQKL